MMTAAGEIDQQVHAAVADPALREALAAGGIGVWSLNLSTGAFTADEAARALWGLGDEDRIASSRLAQGIEPADADEVAAFVAAARAGEPASHLVFRVRCADGEPRWTQVRARAAETPDGRLLIGVALDVTERMRAESALSATEARLRRAQELGGALAFEWDARSDTVVASPAFKALYGLRPDEPMNLTTFLARVHPEDRMRVEEDQYRLLGSPGPYETEFRIVLPNGEVRCVLTRGESIRNLEGLPIGIAGINIDITARKEAEEELRRSKRDARTRFREVRALYQNAPVGLALLDLELRFLRVNEFLTDITGLPAEEHVGRPFFELLPDLRERLEPIVREVVATQEPVRNIEVQGATPGHPDRKVWWRMHLYYMSDDYGATPGVGLVAEDVSAQKSAERTRDLLSRELSHRIKNLFAVVASMVSLSARGNDALTDFARTVRGRIEALGRAHDYVRPAEWGGPAAGEPTSLHGLLHGLLAPYRGADQRTRVEISGDDAAIGPSAATALALSIHEFATNAMKYGALSVPGGRVEIACRGGGDEFRLDWSERGGPPVEQAPAHEGFGTLLAKRSVRQDLGGAISADWARDGLKISLTLPSERLRR
jgi:PAS domain S-box-containing protein